MERLHLKGYITSDSEGIIALSENNPNECEHSYNRYGNSIVDEIQYLASNYGMTGKHHKGLGGNISYIEDCSIRAYFTEEECELEDAMKSMLFYVYGGDIKVKTSYCGYSEWTITGLNLDEFTIGGHDLDKELSSHYGQYCHLIIEC